MYDALLMLPILKRRAFKHSLIGDKILFTKDCIFCNKVEPKQKRGQVTTFEAKKKWREIEKAHADAFAVVRGSAFKEIVEMKQIVRLDELLEVCVKEHDKTQYSNLNYRAYKLKSKLGEHDTIEKKIKFLNLFDENSREFGGKFNSQIVFYKTMGLAKISRRYKKGSHNDQNFYC